MGDFFPRRRVPLALSIFQTGAIMGSGIAFIIGGYVLGLVQEAPPLTLPIFGELRPWQQTFVYLGAPGLLIALLFALLARAGAGAPALRSVAGGYATSPPSTAATLRP